MAKIGRFLGLIPGGALFWAGWDMSGIEQPHVGRLLMAVGAAAFVFPLLWPRISLRLAAASSVCVALIVGALGWLAFPVLGPGLSQEASIADSAQDPILQITITRLPSGKFLEWTNNNGETFTVRFVVRITNTSKTRTAYDVRTDPATLRGESIVSGSQIGPIDLAPEESNFMRYELNGQCQLGMGCSEGEQLPIHYSVDVFYRNRRGGEEVKSSVHYQIYMDRYAIVDRKLP